MRNFWYYYSFARTETQNNNNPQQVANYKKWKQTLNEDDKQDDAFPDDATFLQSKQQNTNTGDGFKASTEILDAILPPR